MIKNSTRNNNPNIVIWSPWLVFTNKTVKERVGKERRTIHPYRKADNLLKKNLISNSNNMFSKRNSSILNLAGVNIVKRTPIITSKNTLRKEKRNILNKLIIDTRTTFCIYASRAFRLQISDPRIQNS